MNLHRLLQQRADAGRPVRVALIGAGKFGSMFLAQVPTIPGLEVPVIVDLDAERARNACRSVGWDEALIAEMVDWARAAGFHVTAAGKGTKYLPAYHFVTPRDVWTHYGLTPEEAK